MSLYLSGSYSNRLDDIVTETVKCDEHEPENEVERLIRQIQAIQKELPAHNDPFLEDEQAYDEAAYEHYALTGYPQVSYQNTRRKPKGFNLICIIIKNFSHIAAVLLVFSKAGGYNN